MEIDYTLYFLATVRAFIVGFGLYFGEKFWENHPPKNEFLLKMWQKDKRSRAWLIKHAWLIGIISFFVFVVLAKNISWWI